MMLAALPNIAAPSFNYVALAPALVVFAGAIIGVLIEAFAKRERRRSYQLMTVFAALVLALAATIANQVADRTGIEASAVCSVRRPHDDVMQGADGAEFDDLAARQFGVRCFTPPVASVARRFDRPRQRRTDHHGIGPAGKRLRHVAAAAHRAVGDHLHVAATRFLEVFAAGRCHLGDRSGHRDPDTEHIARRVCGSATETDEHAGCTGTHEMHRRLVRCNTADNDRGVELVDEVLQIERLALFGDMLSRNRGAADDEDVEPRLDNGIVVHCSSLG